MTGPVLEAVKVRPARTEDAARLIELMALRAEEPDHYLTYTPDEARIPIESMQRSIKDHERENSVMLVAEIDGLVVGDLWLRGWPYEPIKHVADLAMGVHSDFRDCGVGTRLVRGAIDFARRSNILHRIELEVFAENRRAVHLYDKFGFKVEGQKRNYCFNRGRYWDLLVRALLLDQSAPGIPIIP
jgi:ribosomal protein S18 acetylase RimI-like enzyme